MFSYENDRYSLEVSLEELAVFTRDSCTGRYCWERVLAMRILSVCPSVCHDPVRIEGQVR